MHGPILHVDADGESSCEGDCNDSDAAMNHADADGDGTSSCDGDCDDADPDNLPGNTEICDHQDNDCDGLIDADDASVVGLTLFYGDADGDTYGDAAITHLRCFVEPGTAESGDDCDDGDADTYPGAPELCDGLDNDCDGSPAADEDDADGDGFRSCGGDCDDGDASAYPGAAEVCDGIPDNDCDGVDDPQDVDGDGDGYASCEGDCDDTDPQLHLDDADGDGATPCDGDCDDTDPAVGVGALVPIAHPTIQDAIDAAAPGDAICVAAGTYYETIDFSGKDVSVVGVSGPASTWIDGNGVGPVVTIAQGETSAAILAGFTIAGGVASRGAGIYLANSSPTLRDLVVTGNEATTSGGGIYLLADNAVNQASLSDITISANSSGTWGGGVSMLAYDDGEITAQLVDLTMDGNQATYGGAVSLYASSTSDWASVRPTLQGITLESNVASDCGGGFVLAVYGPWPDMSPTFTDVAILDNDAAKGGGGYLMGQDSTQTLELTMQRATFSGNQATDDGGGLRAYSGYFGCPIAVDLDQVQFEENTAGMYGGGLAAHMEFDSLSITADQLEMTGNSAWGIGGGMALEIWYGGATAEFDLSHVRLADNLAGHGGGLGLWANGGDSELSLDQAIITGNYATYDGGGIQIDDLYATSVDVDLEHVVIVGNEAGGVGGGMAVAANNGATLDVGVNHTILQANTASTGGGLNRVNGTVTVSWSSAWDNTPADYTGMADPTGIDGNLTTDALFEDTNPADTIDWDLHLSTASPLVGAGDPALADPDGSVTDMGAYGGAEAASWDLDWDGYDEWWLPGPYDAATSPGMDCDDADEGIYAGNGC